MQLSAKSLRTGLVLLAVSTCCFARGQDLRTQELLTRAQRQVVDYLAQLGNLHCTESVVQQKFAPNGHMQTTQRSTYDYLVIVQGDKDDFQLNESRIAERNAPAGKQPMLVSDGFSTLMLIFHPYYSGAFQFQPGPDEMLGGQRAATVKFRHIAGQRTLAALALRGREYPLALEGTAWLDPESGQVLRIDAQLQSNMSDIGMRSLNTHVEYAAFRLANGATVTLPKLASIEVSTTRQHWRNVHTFSNYRIFGVSAEQNSAVTVEQHPNRAGQAQEKH